MKRPRQLILESVIIGALLLGVTFGGSLSVGSLPLAWLNINNPASISNQNNLTQFALYYNQTLALLGTGQFESVSQQIGYFSFVNYPAEVATTASSANSEITTMNNSISLALLYLNKSQSLANIGLYSNASTIVGSACLEASKASGALSQFENATTPQFSSERVPISEYSVGFGLTYSEVNSTLSSCAVLKSAINAVTSTSSSSNGGGGSSNGNTTKVNFVLSSLHTSVETGGQVGLNGYLKLNTTGIQSEKISFYINGTYLGSTITQKNGSFYGNFSIPFLYEPVATVWANAKSNSSLNFPGAVSNTILLSILFNQTSIVIGDPPAVLPTFNFTVNGRLSTALGTNLPNAPVKITFFSSSYQAFTNSSGTFSKTLKVPANASDGVYYIYASFAPEGFYGPSYGFTSIEVVHEQVNLTLYGTALSLSGFSTLISGKVSSNGSALPNSSISVNSPWGTIQTKSDSSGKFSASINVPALEFASSKSVFVSATPQQPYIDTAIEKTSIGILNPLEIVMPIILLGAVIYETRNLDLLKFRKEKPKGEEALREKIPEIESGSADPEIIGIFKQSQILAGRKLGLFFKRSSTIREIEQMVSSIGAEKTELFSKIAFITEDYLYSEIFDTVRIEEALVAYNELEKAWRTPEVMQD